MSGTSPDRQVGLSLSRRQLVTTISVGALAGSAWAVGLTAIARGREPQLTILGDDSWQITLLESGTNRVLILAGEFETPINREVGQLLTALRQHVDLVIGTGTGLANLSMDGRLTYAMAIQLDAPSSQPDSPRFRALRDPMEVSFDDVRLRLERVSRQDWLIGTEDAAWWLVSCFVDDLIIAFASDLAIISEKAGAATTLAVAPSGSPANSIGYLPGASFVVNAYGGLERDDTISPRATPESWLIRTFPRDSARFRLQNGQIVLPEWAQPMSDKPVGT